MELRHLRYFTTVAAHGSFNRAAQILHVTQPALSRQVKDLEDEVGSPLLVRGRHAVTLTPTGEKFYEQAREILMRATKATVLTRAQQGASTLRVGVLSSMVFGFLTPAMRRFSALQPQVYVEVVELLPGKIQASSLSDSLDIAILPRQEIMCVPDFQWTELLRTTIILVLPESHPLARMRKIHPTRLRKYPVVGYGPKTFPGYVPAVEACLRPFGVKPRFVALIEGGIAALFSSVVAHDAVSLQGHVVEGSLPKGIVARQFSPAVESGQIMVGVTQSRADPNIEGFTAALREEAKSEENRLKS